MPRRPASRSRIAALVLMLALTASPSQSAGVSAWLVWPSHDPARNPLASAVLALRAISDQDEAVAAHITPEGHWQFANRAGETYTAGTPDELKRAPTVLIPNRLTFSHILLSEESLFAGPDALKTMPAAKYSVVIGDEQFPLRNATSNGRTIDYRPYLTIPAQDRDAFAETLAQLRRPLDQSRLRLLAATPGAQSTLPASPKFDAAQGGPAIDPVDPARIPEALGSIPRQTAILTARLDGANLTIAPTSGPDRTVPFVTLTEAAAAADVDLIVLHANPPQQPGGQNWLWQRTQVSGLDQAAKHANLADFFNALAKSRGAPLIVSASPASGSRVTLTARQDSDSRELSTGWIKQAADAVTGQIAGQLTGNVSLVAIHASLVPDARRRELEARLIPGIPSTLQAVYLASLALGLLALPTASLWWRKLWPLEARADYASFRGFVLAHTVRAAAFALIFLPLVGLPALLTSLIRRLSRSRTRAAPIN